ncbi:ferrous iron transport protein A [Candidatus Izemoplasma sp. B36]|uniref:FeoA family protein n=1 Tax=Candidatus Izemoplasma sp. B36 TaxID=3242468 RepID=UPI0035561B2D
MTLKEILPGQSCVVKQVYANNLRKRIIDMGIISGSKVTVKKTAPLGDPIEIIVKGYSLTLRKAEARTIIVDRIEE